MLDIEIHFHSRVTVTNQAVSRFEQSNAHPKGDARGICRLRERKGLFFVVVLLGRQGKSVILVTIIVFGNFRSFYTNNILELCESPFVDTFQNTQYQLFYNTLDDNTTRIIQNELC